jgi:hypothetical protein
VKRRGGGVSAHTIVTDIELLHDQRPDATLTVIVPELIVGTGGSAHCLTTPLLAFAGL